MFWISTEMVYIQHSLVVSWLYTMQPCSVHVSSCKATCRVHACLAVTCHLHLQQNGRDLFRATVVTRRWNGYWNKSQHRKLTQEKKILPLLLLGLKPMTFQSWVWHLNHWALPTPVWCTQIKCLGPLKLLLPGRFSLKRRKVGKLNLFCQNFSN